MRKPMVAGNWKMNKTVAEGVKLMEELVPMINGISEVDRVVCPPFTALYCVSEALKGTEIGCGAQDLFWEEKGAYTGELTPIVCVGETLEENQGGKTEEVVSGQVLEGLKGMSAEDAAKIIVAYEPVWAIGTGLAATGPDANKVIADYIRKPYASMYGEEAAQAIRVLYGGSVKGNNAAEFFGQPDIDGALVGGASLKAPDFTDIVKAAAA